MKKLIFLLSVIITLAACNGRAKNGAQIILGGKNTEDTINIPFKKGYVVQSIDVTRNNKIKVTYKDTTNSSVSSEEYYEESFFGKGSFHYIVKFSDHK